MQAMNTLPTTTTKNETARRLTMPRLLLHAEGLAVFVTSILLYAHLGGNGWLLIALLLVPDLAMVGYAVNPRVGAAAYNAVHTYSVVLLLGMLALAGGWTLGVQLALIWGAHIGMDRTIGYGLKYGSGFKSTHLGRV